MPDIRKIICPSASHKFVVVCCPLSLWHPSLSLSLSLSLQNHYLCCPLLSCVVDEWMVWSVVNNNCSIGWTAWNRRTETLIRPTDLLWVRSVDDLLWVRSVDDRSSRNHALHCVLPLHLQMEFEHRHTQLQCAIATTHRISLCSGRWWHFGPRRGQTGKPNPVSHAIVLS